MAGFGDILSGAQSFFDGVKKTASEVQTQVNEADDNATTKSKFEAIYKTYQDGSLSNWYKAMPYGFKFSPRNGAPITIFLPISPSNLNITTHFATNVITTAYGTVEEHSEQRYFDIVIEGTTGMAPRYVDINVVEKAKQASQDINGRTTFSVQETIPALGGFFQKTIGIANQALNRAADTLAPQKNTTGVERQKTGYAAFHNLYKFFLLYKQDTSGEKSTKPRTGGHPLVFFNYKDNNKYLCSIQRFVLKKSADQPMMYNYSILLRAYKIQGLNADEQQNFDLNDRLKELGLDGVDNSSVFSKVKSLSKGVKDVVGAAIGGTSILGG